MALYSVIIITKNEAVRIEDCLKSVAWMDEIIIVDSGSTDDTVEICRRYTDKILITDDWPGYGIQKQRALEMATGEWVLSLDADERVSPELSAEIQAVVPTTTFDAFEIFFRSEYCGRMIRFGDWWNDSQAVLFRRTEGRFTPFIVHESIEISGSIGRLTGIIYHLTYPNLERVIQKMNDYSTFSAVEKKKKGQKGSVLKAIGHGLWTFIRGYLIRLGFLDGREGFLLAVSNAEGAYYRYLKLMYLKGQ